MRTPGLGVAGGPGGHTPAWGATGRRKEAHMRIDWGGKSGSVNRKNIMATLSQTKGSWSPVSGLQPGDNAAELTEQGTIK